ncbi:MAG: CRISPR-associated helicase Cas3' [Clostridia bacterium]|nr:CRISPR-associated helicase Cas3' [Clostridia bacterium]
MHYAHISVKNESDHARYQTCAEHSRSAASLAQEILKKQNLASTGYLAGLLHDCGKFTDEFNDYLIRSVNGESIRKGSVIHTFAGVSYLLNEFHSKGASQTFDDVVSEIIAAGIANHHGLIDLWDEKHQNGFEYRLSKQPDYDRLATDTFHKECADDDEIRMLFSESRREITEFYQTRLLPNCKYTEGQFSLGLLVRLITSAVVSSDRTDTACFMQNLTLPKPQKIPWDKCAENLESYLSRFTCETPIQNARHVFSDICALAASKKPGLYRLDIPTGGGKTLASLRFAVNHAQIYSMDRIFYIAPLLSIIDQNAQVIKEALQEKIPVLEHHSNVVRDMSDPEEMSRMELMQESWDSPFIITTLVQLLETMFSGKMSSVRRFHCLCGSVIIIDEVQSLPRKLLSLFNCAVNFLTKCCSATVILCSATQPAFEKAVHKMGARERLVSEEIFDQYAPLFRRTEIKDYGVCSMEGILSAAEEILLSSQNLLIVCNTKREASQLFQMTKGLAGIKQYHLSAGMCISHRKQTLKDITEALENHEKFICVSTQVIEAGIDISFQAVIRLSAGLDNVVQTAGRCNRHGEMESSCPVRIYHLLGEKLGMLREIKASQDALNALLAEYRLMPERYGCDLTSDAAVRDYYSFLFKDMKRGEQDYPVSDYTLFDLLSTNQRFIDENGSRFLLNQAFRTAGDRFEVFDCANESVVVPYCEGRELIMQLESARVKYDFRYAEELIKKAKQFTVSVPESVLSRMKAQGMIYTLMDGGIFVLNENFYDYETGIKEGMDSCSTLIL